MLNNIIIDLKKIKIWWNLFEELHLTWQWRTLNLYNDYICPKIIKKLIVEYIMYLKNNLLTNFMFYGKLNFKNKRTRITLRIKV